MTRGNPDPPRPTLRPAAVASAGRLVAVAVAAAAGTALLGWLSGFGPRPFEVVPAPVPLLFGLLFVGVATDALAHLRGAAAAAALLIALLTGVAVTLSAPALPVRAVLGPFAVVGAAALLRLAPPDRSRMLAAMIVYISCTLLANYTFDSFLPVFGWFLLNVGTLFFGITFTQRDRVHAFGRRAVYSMILAAAGANVVLASALGTPLRYVAVSFLSIVLSETADTEIYQRLLHRRWLTRVLSSNAVSAPLDTLVFTLLAFVGQPFATLGWLTRVIGTDIVVKYTSSLVAAIGRRGEEPGAGPGLPLGRGAAPAPARLSADDRSPTSGTRPPAPWKETA